MVQTLRDDLADANASFEVPLGLPAAEFYEYCFEP
jgi:hypothetical protein